MPIYEYECKECGKVFEAIQKFSDPELTACRCEQEAPVKKLMSAAAFHLKGTGWYVTDFRDKDKKKDNKSGDGESKSDGASKSGDGDKSSTSSDSSSSSGSDSGSGSSKSDSTSKSESKSGSKSDAAD